MVTTRPARYGLASFDETLLSCLAETYGIDELTRFRPILLDGDHTTLIDVRSPTSRKMICETAQGQRVFLKQTPWYVSADAQAFALAWQRP